MKTLKKNFSLGAGILVVILIAGCGAPKIMMRSDKPLKAVVIDGKANDWVQPLQSYHSPMKIGYAVTNDADNLYLCLMTADPLTQRKIIMGGLKISIDTAGGKKDNVSVSYPVPGSVSIKRSNDNRQNQGQTQSPDEIRRSLLAQATNIRIKGFRNQDASVDLPLENSYGVDAAIDWNETQNMFYELVIPFKTFYGSPGSVKAGKMLGLEITIVGVSMSSVKKPAYKGNNSTGNPSNFGQAGRMGGRSQYNGAYTGSNELNRTKSFNTVVQLVE